MLCVVSLKGHSVEPFECFDLSTKRRQCKTVTQNNAGRLTATTRKQLLQHNAPPPSSSPSKYLVLPSPISHSIDPPSTLPLTNEQAGLVRPQG